MSLQTRVGSVVLILAILPAASFAQTVDLGFSGAGLMSIQPTDGAYVGSPYLNEGLGGIAPELGAGISVVAPSGFVAAGEFTTARFERTQYGRLAAGVRVRIRRPRPDQLTSRPTKLSLTLVAHSAGLPSLAQRM